MGERAKNQSFIMGAVANSVTTAMKSVTDEVGRLNLEVKELRSDHKDCQESLEASNYQLGLNRSELDDLQDKLNDLVQKPALLIAPPPEEVK